MQKIRLIGISGKAGSGKDTVAEMIRDFTSRIEWKNKKFAGKLKQRLEYTFPNRFNVEEWERGGDYRNDYIPEFDITRRELLIREGMSARGIHPDYWVHALFADYNNSFGWVISDTRFKNEASEIKKRGGIIIRVERPEIVSTSTDPTEVELDYYPFDYTIVNEGTREDLSNKVEQMLQRYFII